MSDFTVETDKFERMGKAIGEVLAACLILAVIVIYGHNLFFR